MTTASVSPLLAHYQPPADFAAATLVGRAFIPDAAMPGGGGPAVVAVTAAGVFDVTATAPTTADLFDHPDPAATVRAAPKDRRLGSVEDLLANADPATRDPARPWFLAPIDVQAIKAAGVTFAASLLERVVEEQAKGDPGRAETLRATLLTDIGLDGLDFGSLRPGAPETQRLRAGLIARGMWSQYLEVGLGPDAEIFTKAQPMSAVGFGAGIGIHPQSVWNNPEPEIVVVVSSRGDIVGATLGNDVNLRDVEGRSALLLGRAKDNNASTAIGPFVRLFDDGFGIADIRSAEVTLTVRGKDGFVLNGASSMGLISRDVLDLVGQAMGPHHQYPDGMVLFLGTMFAPVEDRDGKGGGFTHHRGDIVVIASSRLGALVNRVDLTDALPPWSFGTRALYANLAARRLLKK